MEEYLEMDDFRKLMYGVLVAFIGLIVVWVSIVYISACGFSFSDSGSTL